MLQKKLMKYGKLIWWMLDIYTANDNIKYVFVAIDVCFTKETRARKTITGQEWKEPRAYSKGQARASSNSLWPIKMCVS